MRPAAWIRFDRIDRPRRRCLGTVANQNGDHTVTIFEEMTYLQEVATLDRRTVTPEVAGSSPVAPVPRSSRLPRWYVHVWGGRKAGVIVRVGLARPRWGSWAAFGRGG